MIRLSFLDFELEAHPACDEDYLEIYDKTDQLKRIGKYCGSRYPSFVMSTGNKKVVIFKSNNKAIRTGFKAFYKSLKGKASEVSHCHFSLLDRENFHVPL